jgi:hypothetical protein
VLASASERAFSLQGTLDVSNPIERRISLPPAGIDGASSDVSTGASLAAALRNVDGQASAAAVDKFFTLFADEAQYLD